MRWLNVWNFGMCVVKLKGFKGQQELPHVFDHLLAAYVRGFRIKSSMQTIRIPNDPQKMKHIPIVVRYLAHLSYLFTLTLFFSRIETEANINIHQGCC